MLLAYRETRSVYAVGRAVGVSHQTVERCVRRAEGLGVLAGLDDNPRPGRDPAITGQARTFVVDLACRKAKAWLAAQPEGRFPFVFTSKHGSWLNLIEGFFSKLARSVLRHVRLESKQQLKHRILAAIDAINAEPVVHAWTWPLTQAA